MPEKIVLVSSGQPALNPRLIKEADALSNNGYEVTVLYAYWNEWGTAYDDDLLPIKKWKSICVGGSPRHAPLTYFVSRLLYGLSRFIIAKTGNFNLFADVAIARSSYFLKRAVKNHKADLYIAHNLGALPAVVSAAKANGKSCGFDAEDFHRNENSNNLHSLDVTLPTYLEDKYLRQINYLTTSSPQIAGAYKHCYPALNPVVLLNVFSKSFIQPANENQANPLKLFWFSQTIGPQRGIEYIIEVLKDLGKDKFELNLLGSRPKSDSVFINDIAGSGVAVKFHDPIHPDQLINFAAQFDIGLALENKEPYNRDICLTNKIFTYMQAGLAVIASDTTAQQALMDDNPEIGFTYSKAKPAELKAILLNYDQNRALLMDCKNAALNQAHQRYNWEQESLKFLAIVKNTLSKDQQ